MADAQLSVELVAKIKNFVNGMREAASATKNAEDRITKSTNAISNAVTSKLSGVFSAAAIIGFGKAVIDVTAEFEKFQAVLGNTFGSSALANLKLKELQDFAAKTPFAVNELTGAFVKLANAGFKPTGDQMVKLGDLASSTGKSFDQLAEAIIDAQTGEFERLKEFGIRAKDAGDKVIFTYKGVQTQVEKTSGSIREYITSLGGAEGVSGAMAKISETLGGQISNLGDSWDQMLLSVGGNTKGVFNSAIAVIGDAINKITEYNNELNTVDKYNLGGNGSEFARKVARVFNPFDKSSTNVERAVYGIKQAKDETSEFVSKAIAGAKSAADFGKAIAQLKKVGDASLKYTYSNLPGELVGTKDQFQQGVKALQDARNNFIKEGAGNDANFGTSKGEKELKSFADILKDLNQSLLINENQFQSTFSDTNKAAIASYQSAIESLLNNGFKPLSAEVLKLKKDQQNLFQLTDLPTGPSANKELLPLKNKYGREGVLFDYSKAKDPLSDVTLAQKRIIAAQEQFNKDFNSLVNNGLSEGLGSIGSAIGEALASGSNVIEAAGESILGSLGGILVEFGKLTLSAGIAATALGKALRNPLNPANASIAIGAGVALIAIGSAVGAFSKNIGEGKSANGTSSRSIPQFASGIQNFRGGMALVGERGPELVDLPTGASVIPNGRTERMINNSSSKGVTISTELGISMGVLVAKIRQEEKKLGRLG